MLTVPMTWLAPLAAVLFTTAASAAASPLQLRLGPQPFYQERGAELLHLNPDLLVRNDSEQPYELIRIEQELRAPDGKVLLRRMLDGSGVQPAIATVPNRLLEGQREQLLISPFPPVPARLSVGRVHYQLVYQPVTADDSGDAQASNIHVEADIAVRDYRPQRTHRLPLQGPVFNYDGHDYLAHHRRWDYTVPALRALGFVANPGRFAYDLVPVNGKGDSHNGDATDNRSWFGFGQTVFATADGVIVAHHDGMADNRQFDEAELGRRPMVIYGNHVVVDHGGGEFALYAHLQQGSLQVKPGDTIRAGQPLGRLGASGSAYFPHLHYELRSAAGVAAEGLPVRFEAMRRWPDGSAVTGLIETGEQVEARKR